MAYPAIVVWYVIERKRSQPSHSLWNNISATFVNCTLVILWARVLIYKSLMHQPEVFERLLKKLDGHKEKLPFFFPCVNSPHYYSCEPQERLKGTRLIWHVLDEGLIHSIIVSATVEFFPVIRVLNHFAVGLIDQKKLADGSMHRNTEVEHSNKKNEVAN
uniref:Uncharacterized protein n=1 Tax=Ditylenchus dipsaci TaxID=166011 RepID=A0A915CRX2_9BILA